MWEREYGYIISSHNWSLYVSLLIFTGLALVLALPPGGQTAVISDDDLDLKMLFTIVYIMIYGIVAMNLGQNIQSNSQTVQQSDSQKSKAVGLFDYSTVRRLMAQLAFALFITTPYWIVFKTIIYASWVQIFWGAGHLFIYGFVLGLFGLLLATLIDSEITQFNVKYAVFVGFLLSTLFISALHPLNPFHALSFILEGERAGPSALFFLEGYGALALIGAFLLFLIRRTMMRRRFCGV